MCRFIELEEAKLDQVDDSDRNLCRGGQRAEDALPPLGRRLQLAPLEIAAETQGDGGKKFPAGGNQGGEIGGDGLLAGTDDQCPDHRLPFPQLAPEEFTARRRRRKRLAVKAGVVVPQRDVETQRCRPALLQGRHRVLQVLRQVALGTLGNPKDAVEDGLLAHTLRQFPLGVAKRPAIAPIKKQDYQEQGDRE